MEITVASIAELEHVVAAVEVLIRRGIRIFLLTGDLGAGKTTFVKKFCEASGVDDPASSPTFSLVNAYESPRHGTIYHMDLYRLSREMDLEQIGFDEYIESGNLCFIEWPALGASRIPPPYSEIVIETGQNNYRIFSITTYDTVDA
jgi:tRNA threonylcarbamoyladenosine biosynthesis protein TsaE